MAADRRFNLMVLASNKIAPHNKTVPINSPVGKIGNKLPRYKVTKNILVDEDLVYVLNKLNTPIMPNGVVKKCNATLIGF